MYLHIDTLLLSQDRGCQRGESGDQADEGRNKARADWSHHTLRRSKGICCPLHAAEWLHAPETLPGQLIAVYRGTTGHSLLLYPCLCKRMLAYNIVDLDC